MASSDDVIELQIDSTLANSLISRRGMGKIWHVELRDPWIQQEAKGNPEDVGTKFLAATE